MKKTYIQLVYCSLMEELNTNSIEESWNKIEDKTSEEAAQFLRKVYSAFYKIMLCHSEEPTDINVENLELVETSYGKMVSETETAWIIKAAIDKDNECYLLMHIDKDWLKGDMFINLCQEAVKKLTEIIKKKSEEVKIKEASLAKLSDEVFSMKSVIYELDNDLEDIKQVMEENTDIRLRNRYGIDIRLRACESRRKWKLIVPKDDANYIQLNYEGTHNAPHYVSIDPPGGPFLALGKNTIQPYASKELIDITINRIYEENSMWYLETEEIP